MYEECVVRNCAPTLAGIKTASLFTCPYENKEQFLRAIRRMNRLLVPKGIRIIPLRYDAGRVLVYLYRPDKLQGDFSDGEALRILQEAGYSDLRQESCILELIRRLNAKEEFPHEIGLFLGYPPEDVRGFIDHRGNDCKCVGCWKVYGDEVRAKHLFAAYKKCTAQYCRWLSMGASVERLAVSISH